MKLKEESAKAGLKLNIQNTKIMAPNPFTSLAYRWRKNGNSERLFFGSKVNMDGNCRHEIKRHLLLGRKAITNPDSILKKQRHHFAKKGPYSQSYVFSSSHVHCESWTIKNAEC